MDQRYMERVHALEGFQEIRILRHVGISRNDFVADLREYFMGVIYPSRHVASQIVKRRIGLSVAELHWQRVEPAVLSVAVCFPAKLYSGCAIMDQPECAPLEALLDKLVRSAVIAWISAIFGSVPFVVLLALVHFGGNGSGTSRTSLFWGYMAIHILLCSLVVSIFLASV
eukprot:s10344_g1.t1